MDLAIRFPGGARVDAELGAHTIHTDQRIKRPGEGSAPTLLQSLLGSLGTRDGVDVLGFCQTGRRRRPTVGRLLVDDIRGRIVRSLDPMAQAASRVSVLREQRP